MIDQVFALGSNFKLLDTNSRSKYALQYTMLQNISETLPMQNYFLLNTCNRSEIFGIGDLNEIKELIFHTIGVSDEDQKKFFSYQGKKAVEHIFSVACGLDSQIIGDNEIAGQFKNSFIEAKKNAPIHSFLEKMHNLCLQAAKEIKTNTNLSNGTKSVSYAATKHILNLKLSSRPNILIIGCGSIGKAVARNLKEYMPNAEISLCNRTHERADQLAQELGASIIPYENLCESVGHFEVIVSCVSVTDKKLLHLNMNWQDKKVHITDLAVPSSVDQEMYALPQFTIENVDTISKELLKTLEKRNRAIPSAKKIMQAHIAEFESWSKVYENKISIAQWQEKFDTASLKCPFMKDLSNDSKRTLKNKSTALFVEFIRHEDKVNKNNIIEYYRSDTLNNSICHSVNDCFKNKLNCLSCSSPS